MDWLNRARQFVGNLFGGAQRTIGQISGNVARGVGRAEQQAARTAQQVVRQIPQPPRIQLPQIPQVQMPRFQAPRVQLPQAPKIDLAAVGKALSDYYGKTALSQTTPQNAQKAISQINLNNIGKTLKEQGIGMLRQATGNVFIPSAGEINPENIMKYGTEKDKQALQKYFQTGKAGDVAIAPQVTRQGQTIYAPKGLSTAQQIANPLLAGLFWAGAKGPNVASSAAGKLAEGAASMGVSNVATGAVSRYGETGKLSEAFQPKALAIDLGTGLVTGALFQAPGAIKAYKGQKALSAIGGQIKLQNLAKFVDKNAPITVRTLPEKGALRAQGYTNVKVQFQPKPGQVAPTMQGAIPQMAPKVPKGQEALFAEARKYKSAKEFIKSQGKPLYHGTFGKFDTFDANKLGSNTGANSAKEGFFFTPQKEVAKTYITKGAKETGNSLRTQKSINNEIIKLTGGDGAVVAGNKLAREELFGHNIGYDKSIRKQLDKLLKQYDKSSKTISKYEDEYFMPTDALSNAKGSSIIEARVRFNKPKIIDAKGANRAPADYTDAIKKAKKDGYDGVIIKNTFDRQHSLLKDTPHEIRIAFNSSQIKTKSQLNDIWNQANKQGPSAIYENVPKSYLQPKGEIPKIAETPKSSVQTVIDALAEAKPIRGKQERLYSIERGKRIAKVAAMGEKVPGEKGYFAQLGQLKGELPKVQFEGIRKQITQPVVDDLFNQIEKSTISPFEKVTAKTGLAKLLGAQGGSVPTRGELSLLNEVFPKELTQAILAKRTVMQKLGSIGGEIINLPRSIQASVDLSGPLRQGALLIGRPKQWIPAFASMFKYAGSEKAYQGLMENIRMRPTYQAMRQSKLALTDMSNPLQGREEAFMSNLAERIPIIGRVIKGSDRAYTGFINKLRADTFDDLLSKAKQTGAFDNNPNIADDIAKFVNTATGRGNLPGSVERAAVVLNGAFFSPRLMASRIQTLNPMYYVKLDPFVRKEALKSLLTFAGTAASIVGMTKLAGADVGIDPRSADFGKIKIGDTRYDPWAGFQQYIVLGSRLLTGQMISSTTGKEIRLGEGYKTPNRLDIIARFFQSKESPVASFVTGLLQQQTATGEKFNIPAEVVDRFIPMMANDLYDLYREYGTKGLAMGIPGLFGAGSQTYTDQIPMKGKTATGKENIQWRQAPSLGETIVNKVTGTQISNIPKEQWASLQEKKKIETQWGIDLAGIKAKVLTTGESQTVKNPVNGKDIQIFLKDGIVTTKDIKPKQAKTPKIKVSKARKAKGTGRGRTTRARISLKTPRLRRISVSVPKGRKVSFKQPASTKARKSIKIKTG